jgi:peptidyl-prolyl cis-trans isomerase SurA
LNKTFRFNLMKIRLTLIIALSLLLPGTGIPQNTDEKILMTVDGRNVSAGEFVRMYKKSYDTVNTKDLDTYLGQFVIFRLKVADAIREGYDTTKAFKTELQGYRTQLAQNYLTDNEAKEKLLKQAYQRSLTEINGWHILINCPAEATPEDTLKAWKKARDVRERINRGEPFEEVARGTSDDPSVKINGGNLGYFTVFQMIMPFEDAAYKLRKGEVSEPVRTPYGYHIITVTGKRPSVGKIKVAHIMKTVPPGTPEPDAKKAGDEIADIYDQLLKGASFSELAAKYSDHKESASNGGELNWFGAGEIISDFAEAAFSLPKNGDFTKPLKTAYGWHIIKRIDRKAPGSYEETRSWLESKLNESYLNSISKKSFIEKLKKEYKYRINTNTFNWFVNNTDTLIIRGKAKYKRAGMPTGAIYTFADQQLSTRDFASSIEKRGSMIVTDDPAVFITGSLNTRLSDQILSYENSVLEKKYPEFRYLMNEFHDGILLFEISGKKVWNKAQDDSAGLQKYYGENKNKYLSKTGITGKIYTLKKGNGMKALTNALKKYSKYPDGDKKLIEKFISKNDTLLTIKEGTWYKGDNSTIDNLNLSKSKHETIIDGSPSVVIVNKVIEAVPLPFTEVQGEMITGYQESLEENWIKQLKVKYSVKIDNGVLEEIRKNLNNEQSR